MSPYKTGDETDSVFIVGHSDSADSSQSEISYKHKYGDHDSTSRHRNSSHQPQSVNSSSREPTTPSPSIRKELSKAMNSLCVAADAMLTAHDGDGVDVVELANAVGDFRDSLEILWLYREFGMEAWRSVIVFCQQALCENMHDEEMRKVQCACLKKLAVGYLANRMLSKCDVTDVMSLLADSGFDPLLFFSQPNGVK